MVTISKPQTKGQAKNYYQQENYYQNNSEIGKLYGNALEYFGLEQGYQFNEKEYEQLLDGFNPVTNEALVQNAGDENRRVGIDVTTNAPKSFSLELAGLINNQLDAQAELLQKAQEKANITAIEKLQSNFGYAKVWDKDKQTTVSVKAEGLVWASFNHNNTRETNSGHIDMHEHTHNFLFNQVLYRDEHGRLKWAAMQNDEIYRAKMFLGQLYRNELAKELKALGYELDVDAKTGFFELSGYSKEYLQEFSGRAKELRETLAEIENETTVSNKAKMLNEINAKTKKAKKHIDEAEWRAETKNRMDKNGLSKAFYQERISKLTPKEANIDLVQEHITRAAQSLTNNQSVYTQKQILIEAMKHGLHDGLTEHDYLVGLTENSTIISLGQDVYSTHEMVAVEKSIIEMLHISKGTQSEILPNISIDENMPENMTRGQKNFYATVLNSQDRFICVLGAAGSGKTYSVAKIKETLEQEHVDIELQGLAFMGKAAEGLEADSGIKSTTIDRFLIDEAKVSRNENSKPRLLFVDEAGMVGSKHVARLMEYAAKSNTRIIFIGDTNQFQSVAAGRAFADLIKHGAQTVYMDEVKRQETDYMMEAVTKTRANEAQNALSILEQKKQVNELSRDEQIAEIVSKYWELKDKNKDYRRIRDKEPLVIASKNMDRNALNEAIRIGNASTKQTRAVVFKTLNLDGTAAQYAKSYAIGVVIQGDKSIGLKQGFDYEVIGHKDDKTIILKGGKELNIYEHYQKIQAFKQTDILLAENERIIFGKNITDRKSGFQAKNGERGTITEIMDDGRITILNDNNQLKTFDIKKHNYLDYGYAITDYKSQGMTSRDVLIMADAQSSNLNSFYVQLTRASHNTHVYTNNIEELKANVTKPQMNTSTLDYTMKGGTNGRNETTRGIDADTSRDKERATGRTYETNRDRERHSGNISDISGADGNRRGRNTRITKKEILLYAGIDRVQKSYNRDTLRESRGITRDSLQRLPTSNVVHRKSNTRGADASVLLSTHSQNSLAKRRQNTTNHNLRRAHIRVSKIGKTKIGRRRNGGRAIARINPSYQAAVSINEIKRTLPPQKVLEAFGLLGENYSITKRVDEYRIRSNGSNQAYNTYDFLLKHIGLKNQEAAALLKSLQAQYQISVAKEVAQTVKQSDISKQAEARKSQAELLQKAQEKELNKIRAEKIEKDKGSEKGKGQERGERSR
ncbi:MAG: MobF family relaxase [Campylobacterales bacterium]|nr:MobF family relaxase [Campylobacterales bacterium]